MLVIRNRCDRAKVDPQFGPLIDAAIAAYAGVLPNGIVDIRLLGSVARGEAAVGRSDIDFMAILTHAPGPTACQELQDVAEALRSAHPIVTRVELDMAPVGELSAFQRFVLSSDSLSVYGTDELTRSEQSVTRDALALLVTPDAASLIRDCRAAVEACSESTREDELRFYSRVIGKDLLKCLRFVVLLRGGEYEPNIDRIYRQVADLAPEFATLARELHRLYRHPSNDRALMLSALNHADTTLRPIVPGSW